MSTAASNGFNLRPLTCYLWATMSYGFIRSVTYNWKGKWECYDSVQREMVLKEKLITEKAGGVLLATFAAPSVWPIMIFQDLRRMECAVRGKQATCYDSDFW